MAAKLRERLDAVEGDVRRCEQAQQHQAVALRMPTGPRWSTLTDFEATWPSLDKRTQRDVLDWLTLTAVIDQRALRSMTFAADGAEDQP